MNFGLSYTTSTAGMDTIHLGAISAEAAEQLDNFNYDFTNVNSFSDLDISKLEFTGNLDISLSRSLGLTFGFIYEDYSDDDPYLMDTTGTYMWGWAGLRYSF